MTLLEIRYPIVLSGVPINNINNPVLVASTSNEFLRVRVLVKRGNINDWPGIAFSTDKTIFTPSDWLTHRIKRFYTTLREVLGYDIKATVNIVASTKPVNDYLAYSIISYMVIKETSRLEGVSLSSTEIHRFLNELDDLVSDWAYMEKAIIKCYRLGLTNSGFHLCRAGEESISMQSDIAVRISSMNKDETLKCFLTTRELDKLGDLGVLVVKLLGYTPVEVYEFLRRRDFGSVKKLLELEDSVARTLCSYYCSSRSGKGSVCKLVPWSHGLFINTCITLGGGYRSD